LKRHWYLAIALIAVAGTAAAFAYSSGRDSVGTGLCTDATIDRVACIKNWALGNIDELPKVLDTLTELNLNDKEFSDYACHDVWHAVGEEAGRMYELSSALDAWSYSCYGGFLHGAMSTSAETMGLDGFSAAAQELCSKYSNRVPVVGLDCWHGVGHGFAHVLTWPESMNACVPVAVDAEALAWCTWGASETLSENFLTDSKVRAELTPKLDSLCDSLELGQDVCFRVRAPMLYSSGWDFIKIYTHCTTASESARQACGFSAGQILGTEWLDGLAEASECYRYEEMAAACAAGMGKNVGRVDEWGILRDSPRRKSDSSLSPCSEFASNPQVEKSCADAEKEIRSIELSPIELELLTRKWWDGVKRPTTVTRNVIKVS
jgi:hypothetical protein